MEYKLSILLICLCLYGCVSSSEDYETAGKVAAYLKATGVIPADTREAGRTHIGKISYVGPGTNNSPHFTFYEVTSPEEIAKLENAAKNALSEIPKVNKITLHFYEKQVVYMSENGGMVRNSWKEKEIKKIVVKR